MCACQQEPLGRKKRSQRGRAKDRGASKTSTVGKLQKWVNLQKPPFKKMPIFTAEINIFTAWCRNDSLI